MLSATSNHIPETNKYNRSIARLSSNDDKSSITKASTPLSNNISSSETTTDYQSNIVSQKSSNSDYLNQLSKKNTFSALSSKFLFS